MSRRNKQKGFSLVEVLLGMFILTVGILGMASIQILAKRLGYDAMQRSIAINLAHDITERIRSNHYVIDDYVTSNLVAGGVGDGKLNKPSVDCMPANGQCVGADCQNYFCTNAQNVMWDLYEWEQALDGFNEKSGDSALGGLVSPRGCISSANGLINVVISWRGFQTLGNPQTGNAFADACGVGQDLYGAKEKERQLILFTTFISPN